MNKLNKRAFTLVELLVVIAILAVLATAAIIGYSSFIEKANVSNDNTVVTELNRFTDAYIAGEGKINTVTDIANELKKDGFLVSTLKPSASKDLYAFNIDTKKFLVIDTEDVNALPTALQDKADIFVLVGSEKAYKFATENHLSMYLQTTGYSFGDTIDNLETGLDVGEVTGITAINYDRHEATSKLEVVIRTNGGTLTINAPADTVKHYGTSVVIDVKAIASTSYHEYGTVSFAKIATGRIVVTEDCKIGGIHIVATESGDDMVYQPIAVAIVGNAELPTLTRDSVTEENNDNYAILVVNVQTLETEETVANNTNTEKIWVIGVTENETKTVSTIATDTTADSNNASSNAKTEETLSESAITLVSSESTVKESTDEEDAQTIAIIEVLPESGEGAFSLSCFEFTSTYGGEYVGVRLNNAPDSDPGKYTWEASDSTIVNFNKFYDADYDPYEVLLLRKPGKVLITATLKADNSIKAYYVVDIKAELNLDDTISINMFFPKKVTSNLRADVPVKLYIDECPNRIECRKLTSIDIDYFENYRSEWSIIAGEDNATLSEFTKARVKITFSHNESVTIRYVVYDENNNALEVEQELVPNISELD